MSELLTHSNETDLPTPQQVDTIRNIHTFILNTLATKCPSIVHPELRSAELIDRNMQQLAKGEIPFRGISGWALEQTSTVRLRSDYIENVSDQAITEQAGYIDEDSFDFVWQLMERVAELDQTGPQIEITCMRLLEKYKFFVFDDENYERFVGDPRLKGISHLNAAVELTQVRDFEAALTELEHIPEPRLRGRLMHLLSETVEREVTPLDEQESKNNLENYLSYVGVGESTGAIATETRIATNRSTDTFLNMFDPFSDGRIYPAGYHNYQRKASKKTKLRPSSGDGDARKRTEKTLGHTRGLFTPRLVYGVVVDAENQASDVSLGWNYGGARFILREDSHSAQHSTFCVGDSLNGTTFTQSRRLLRSDANVAAAALRERHKISGPDTSPGSIYHFIEAQFEGLHISNIESVILRPGIVKPEMTDKLVEAAARATEQGINVQYIFDWQKIQDANKGTDSRDLLDAVITRVQQLKQKHPKIQFSVNTNEAAIIDALGHHKDLLSIIDLA